MRPEVGSMRGSDEPGGLESGWQAVSERKGGSDGITSLGRTWRSKAPPPKKPVKRLAHSGVATQLLITFKS